MISCQEALQRDVQGIIIKIFTGVKYLNQYCQTKECERLAAIRNKEYVFPN